jgi:hypothetical protein
MEQDKNYMLPLYIDGLKHFSNQELKDIKNSIENRLKEEFFENFKLQVNKCYVSIFDLVLIKIKSVSKEFEDSIKIICEYYSIIDDNRLYFDDNSVVWFHRGSVAQFSQEEFEEISEDKYNKITEQLKSFEKQQEELNEKRDKFIKSILK